MSGPGPSVQDIVGMLAERRRRSGLILTQMRNLRDAYNGDIVIPLPELDRNEDPAVANIIAMGLDQIANRVASVQPNLYYPPVRPNIKVSQDKADVRTRATLGWWETNKLPIKLRRRARHLIGYSSAPVVLRPNPKQGIARWQLRDPLNTYPCVSDDPDDMTPEDVIFAFRRSMGWLRCYYPAQAAQLQTGVAGCSNDQQFECAEYMDGESIVLAVIGSPNSGGPTDGTASVVELERLPNRTGMCLAVVPGRVTLDRPKGQFDGMIGMFKTQARITALELIAVERGIFPDTYLVSRPNGTARFIHGPVDGRTGEVNVVADGDIVQPPGTASWIASTNMADRLERAQRVSGGIAAELGGESQENVRTGKRGDAILSAVTDFPVQEAQEILATSLVEENKRAVAIALNYFGNQRRSFYVSTGKKAGHVDYVPREAFENDHNVVTYPMAGADANGLVIGIGQRVGLGTMSKRSAQFADPMIADPDMEHQQVLNEGLEAALLQSVQQQAAAGTIPPADLARIQQLVALGSSLADAVSKAQGEAQSRQATPAPQGAPETQPGLAIPGQGQEQPAAISGPNPSQQNLSDLLNTLRRPVHATPQEMAA